MTHTRLHSGVSLLAAALTGAVAPAQGVDKESNMGNISAALAREIFVAAVGVEGSRERSSGAPVGRVWG